MLEGKSMEGVVGEEEDFDVDAGLDRETLKVDECGGDLLQVETLTAEFSLLGACPGLYWEPLSGLINPDGRR